MKKLLSLLLVMAFAMSMLLTGCNSGTTADNTSDNASESTSNTTSDITSESTSESLEIVSDFENPMTEVSEQEAVEQTGIDLPTPEGAEEVVYYVIDTGDDNKIVEMDFTLNGKTAYLRAKSTGELENAEDISGLYYDWTSTSEAEVNYCTANVYVCESESVGYIAWLDVVPGIVYNLGMTSGADADTLIELANTAFVPVQGEVDGDVSAETSIG